MQFEHGSLRGHFVRSSSSRDEKPRPKLELGSNVEIHGLQKGMQYNGCRGRILELAAANESNRFEVQQLASKTL